MGFSNQASTPIGQEQGLKPPLAKLFRLLEATMRPARPPHPNPRPPRFKLPSGACDTHLHVYGPFDRYPLIPERNYDPDPRSTLDGATLRLAG